MTESVRLAGGYALLLMAAACSSGRGASAGGGAAPAPVEARRIASLPENPCELLTPGQLAVATGLRVDRARRVPDIEEIISSQKEGRRARASTICSYETPSPVVAITIMVQPLDDRTSTAYWKARETYFSRLSAKPIAGLGEDAWLAGGTTLHVLAGKDTHFVVATRMAQPSSPEIVAAVARAVLDRLYR